MPSHPAPPFQTALPSRGEAASSKCQELYNRKTIAYEMEAGGFANACDHESVPFVVIRGISDWADQDASDETWRSYASRTASLFMYELLKVASIQSR